MIQNIVTSIILYSGTAVDLLIILMLFFAKRKSRKDIINIYLGQFLGSVSLIFLSLLFAFVLNYIPSKEILGLLGLIPIFLGLKVLLLGDSDGEAIAKDGLRKDNKNLIFLVAMITFASCGADNIGVFVPYFTTLNLANLIVTLLTFLVLIYLLVFSAQKLAQVPSVGETLEKYSRWFIAVVYLGLGMYILIEKDSICQVDVINQQNVTTATNYLEKEKVQKSLRILSKFTDNKQINIIFYLLAVEELCVCDIACLLNLSMASASHHLRKLANQNILDTRREGKIIYYFIKDEEIRDFFNQLG